MNRNIITIIIAFTLILLATQIGLSEVIPMIDEPAIVKDLFPYSFNSVTEAISRVIEAEHGNLIVSSNLKDAKFISYSMNQKNLGGIIIYVNIYVKEISKGKVIVYAYSHANTRYKFHEAIFFKELKDLLYREDSSNGKN